jgi:hypothetical protein
MREVPLSVQDRHTAVWELSEGYMVWRLYVEHPATGKLDIERLKRLGIFKIFDRLNHTDAGA